MTTIELRRLAKDHMLRLELMVDNYPYETWIIVKCAESNTLLSEFVSAVEARRPQGAIWRVAVEV